MKIGLLFSGGKDSTLAGFLAKKYGYEIVCLISIVSHNPDSYMYHTPSISATEKQAEAMGLPIVVKKTWGEREREVDDLKRAIEFAIEKYGVEGIVTGAVESVYQASRIQSVCDKIGVECFNPLWQKNQIEILEDVMKNKFDVIITGVAAEGLDKSWLGKKIDDKFIEEIKKLETKYKLNPAGEGGEFETLVLDCPLFKYPLKIKNKKISGQGNSWRAEVEVEK